jgi:membrane protease YdiL (CAAX protease family)
MGMKERLRAADYRFVAVCLGLLAAATWYSVRNFYRAFPEASIDFRVSRAEAQVLASRFLSGQGYHLAGYSNAARFSFDEDAKTFLEREAGLEQANEIMGRRIRLWRWSYRWFRPQQKEEYRVDFTTRGELAGFEHLIPEEAARPAVTAAEARVLAEDFLRTRLGRDPGSLEFVELSEVTRPNRQDRLFTWSERGFQVHDATYRVEITMLGNEIGAYREYLKIPEQWTRDYQRLRSKNDVTSTIDAAVMVLLLAGLIAVLVVRVRRKDVRWRVAGLVGAAAAGLSLLASLNEFPLQQFAYPTTDSYGSFLATRVLQAVLVALAWGMGLFAVTAGAEPIYREAFPGKISLQGLFSWRGLRTKRFLLGSILGISLCGIFIAYQTGFYILANRFGAWAPADVPYTDLLNTRFPWLFVLVGGFLPAVSEEFLFRMFAIPFLRKLARSMALALVGAGFIWGFGHAGYPNQPFYIRGVEVGIGGVALGLILLRWGILPTLVWHYSVDAMYSAMLLVRSGSLYFRLSGAAAAGILVLPVVLALAAYWRRGGFEPEHGLRNGDEPAPVPEVEAEVPEPSPKLVYGPLAPRWRVAALVIFALGMLSLLIPVTRFGDSPVYRISDAQAGADASAFLRTQGLDPATFRQVTYPAAYWGGENTLAAKYLLDRRPLSDVSGLFARNHPVQHWLTRYFRSGDTEEASVAVHPETGRMLGFEHVLPEDRPGADLAPDAALQIASSFAGAQGWDLHSMELKESSSEKKKARRDHTLVWEAVAGDPRNVDEARYRLSITVAGDRVSSWRTYWKVPESYVRSRERQNALSIGLLTLRIGVVAGAVLWGLWLLIQNIRKGLVPWRAAMRVAVPATLIAGAGPLLSYNLLLRNYNTAVPLNIYQATMAAGLVISVVFLFLMLAGICAFLASLYPDALSSMRSANRRLLGWDAAVVTLMAIGAATGLGQFMAWLNGWMHKEAILSVSTPDLIASAAPAAAALAGAVRAVLLDAALLALATVLFQNLRRSWLLVPLALAACAGFASGDGYVQTWSEFGLQYGLVLLTFGGIGVFCFWFARRNYLAYALVFLLLALRAPLMELLGTGNRALEVQGFLAAGVVLAVCVWAVLPSLGRSQRVGHAAAPA